jgi:hypothetical protein
VRRRCSNALRAARFRPVGIRPFQDLDLFHIPQQAGNRIDPALATGFSEISALGQIGTAQATGIT